MTDNKDGNASKTRHLVARPKTPKLVKNTLKKKHIRCPSCWTSYSISTDKDDFEECKVCKRSYKVERELWELGATLTTN